MSPIDGKIVAQVADCGQIDVDRAVAAARRSFEQGGWAGLDPRKRKAALQRWAGVLRDHADELALLETLDAGKPIGDTTSVDIPGAIYGIEWFAETIDKIGGEVAPVDTHLVGLVTREPIGVVAAIVPWNFPLLMASWKFRARARGRQQCRAQALREVAAHGDPRHATGARRGDSRGRVQCRARLRRDRQAARPA
ncbi:MAG: aldehyde dehydrogenase family protein [Pararobbsia sp.]